MPKHNFGTKLSGVGHLVTMCRTSPDPVSKVLSVLCVISSRILVIDIEADPRCQILDGCDSIGDENSQIIGRSERNTSAHSVQVAIAYAATGEPVESGPDIRLARRAGVQIRTTS